MKYKKLIDDYRCDCDTYTHTLIFLNNWIKYSKINNTTHSQLFSKGKCFEEKKM